MENNEPTAKPRDAHTVEAVLKSMGVESYDPRVVNQLLELLYRYVSSVLTESRVYSEHADKSTIDLDDIRLAIRSKCSFHFTQPPPREVTMRLASERNAIPLPPVDQRAGVALPPAEYQLTAQNYRVVIDKKRAGGTPQSSPKRPRLVSSPVRSMRTPEKSAGSRTPPNLKSSRSPRAMNIDSPARKGVGSSPGGKRKSLSGNIGTGLTATMNKSPRKMVSPGAAGTTKKISPSGNQSPGLNASAPDVVMVDAAPKGPTSTAGVLDALKPPDVGAGLPMTGISPMNTSAVQNTNPPS